MDELSLNFLTSPFIPYTRKKNLTLGKEEEVSRIRDGLLESGEILSPVPEVGNEVPENDQGQFPPREHF